MHLTCLIRISNLCACNHQTPLLDEVCSTSAISIRLNVNYILFVDAMLQVTIFTMTNADQKNDQSIKWVTRKYLLLSDSGQYSTSVTLGVTITSFHISCFPEITRKEKKNEKHCES